MTTIQEMPSRYLLFLFWRVLRKETMSEHAVDDMYKELRYRLHLMGSTPIEVLDALRDSAEKQEPSAATADMRIYLIRQLKLGVSRLADQARQLE